MVRAVYRKMFVIYNEILMLARITHLKLKYSGLKITGDSKIGKHCDIRCIKGSTMCINNSHISDGCLILADHNSVIEIENAFIGPNCAIVAQVGIKIDANSQIAEMVTIRDQNHSFGEHGRTIAEQGFQAERIHIGKNVWIASKASILKGVQIGDNCVIGAHSLVNKSCEANAVYAGIPAKKIKNF